MLPVKKGISRIMYDLILSIGVILLVFGILMINTSDMERKPEESSLPVTAELQVATHEILYQELSNQLTVPKDEEINVVIPPGSTGIMIASVLEKKGLMEAKDFHKLMVLFGIERRLKAGEYTFSSEDSPIDVLDKILLK